MEQSVQGKIKLYRNLKVIFYCLGLPLFVLAVIMTATWLFVGETPYVGSGGSTAAIWFQNQLAGSGLYGVWIALGVWLIIAIVHIILKLTVNNHRARTVLVAVIALIAMMVPVVVMDIVLPLELDKIETEAETDITIPSYKAQLSELVGKTGSPSGLVSSFVSEVNNFLTVYNIGYSYSDQGGLADNTANAPATYESLYNVDENGNVTDKLTDEQIERLKKQYGDGTGTDHSFVRVPPNADGKLEIDGVVYENYTLASWNVTTNSSLKIYHWYKISRNSEYTDGIYGEALYNANGMLSDGYVYGIDVALEILRQYYLSQDMISSLGGSDDIYTAIYEKALELQEADYSVEGTEKYEIWHNYVGVGTEDGLEAGFSITAGTLTQLLNSLGSNVGNNIVISAVFSLLGNFDFSLENISISDDISLSIVLLTEDHIEAGKYSETFILKEDESYSAGLLVRLIMGEETMDIQLDGTLLDNLGALIDTLLVELASLNLDEYNGSAGQWLLYLLNEYSLLDLIGISDILDLFGLDLSSLLVGITDDMTTGEILQAIILNLLSSLYWYSDPEILPVYDYYEAAAEALGYDSDLGYYYAMLDKAIYNGGWHGYMIGAVLIPNVSLIAGDTIGSSYTSDFALSSYSAVVQLQTDLLYKPIFYPLYSVRNLLLTFTPVVLFCLIISGLCAEKEWLLATGRSEDMETEEEEDKNEKKGKKKKKKIDEEQPDESGVAVFDDASGESFADETSLEEEALDDVPLEELETATGDVEGDGDVVEEVIDDNNGIDSADESSEEYAMEEVATEEFADCEEALTEVAETSVEEAPMEEVAAEKAEDVTAGKDKKKKNKKEKASKKKKSKDAEETVENSEVEILEAHSDDEEVIAEVETPVEETETVLEVEEDAATLVEKNSDKEVE